MEVSVLPNSFAAGCSEHLAGSVSDIDIMVHMKPFHDMALAKTEDEKEVTDIGILSDKYPDSWALLADKGYQGAVEFVRAIYPWKKPPRWLLSAEDDAFNKKVSADRIIVENVFGRACALWAVLSAKFMWGRSFMTQYFGSVFL